MEHITKNSKQFKLISNLFHVSCSTCTSKIYRRSMLHEYNQMSQVMLRFIQHKKTKIQRTAKRLELKAFTLLELLLVIAIIAVLAGIITFALKPADTFQKANSAKLLSDQSSIKKALNSYMVDSGGNLPTVFNSLTYGYYDICKQGQSGNCVSLDELITSKNLSSIPFDSNNQTATITGFKVKYNPVKTELSIYNSSEYTQWAQSNGLTLSDGLVGYWKMDEGSWNGTAGEVKDSSGQGNHGIAGCTGAGCTIPTIGVGAFGNAGDLNTNAQTLSLNGNYGSAVQSITMAVWVKKTSNGSWGTLLGKNDSCGGSTWNVGIVSSGYAGSGVTFRTNSGGCVSVAGTIPSNVWSHVLSTYDGNTVRLYVDGALVGIASYTGTLNIGSGWKVATSFSPPSYGTPTGFYDEVRIYNRALNTVEIKALYELAPAPIAHWKFNETSGTTASDSSGNSYSGTLTSGPVWATGKFGNGLQFDGVDDYVPVTINVPETNYTYSSWFKTSDSGGSIITVVSPVTTTAGGHDRQFGISNTGRFCHRVWADETYCGANVVNDNQWHYAAVTVGSGGGKLYIDGVQVATGAKTASDFSSESGIVMGNHNWGSWGPYAGIIDDLKIYNYVRTPAQILWEYNQGI